MSIELTDVHKAFGENRVLAGLSLEVEEGQTVAVIGASGVGKSVMLKHVVRLILPDAGAIQVDGEVVGELNEEDLYELRRKVGYVFQFAALFDSLSVEENVGLGLRRMKEFGREEIEERVKECLDLVEMEGYGDRFPAELSGGQKKRIGLARAIATRPKYLLYDEPTTGLDPVTTTVIDHLIMRMREELGVTSLMVTHNMESAYRVADRIGLLHDGRIRFIGSADELKSCEDPVVRGFIEGKPELWEAS